MIMALCDTRAASPRISWIPSEAVTGAPGWPSDAGFTHYDDPRPPRSMTSRHCGADKVRFANVLPGRNPNGAGQTPNVATAGAVSSCDTTIKRAGVRHTFQNGPAPDLRRDPERGDGWVRFVQPWAGRTAARAAQVRHKPYIQWQAPLVWTTLSLTLHADGTAETAMTGGEQSVPRHWILQRRWAA